MNGSTRNVAYFAAGVLAAAALYGIYVKLAGRGSMTSDDDPIVVAGGSLNIDSTFGFQRDDKYNAHHAHPTRKLIGVGVYYNEGTNTKPQPILNGATTIEFAFCPSIGGCANGVNHPDDKITLKTNSGGQQLTVSNTQGTTYGIGDEAQASPLHIMHQPPDRRVWQITVNGAPYGCFNATPCMVGMIYRK